jgi:hypothetical protein
MYVCYTNITLYIAFGIIRGFTEPRYVLERITRKYGGTPVLRIVSVRSRRYPATMCMCYIVPCCLSRSTIFSHIIS